MPNTLTFDQYQRATRATAVYRGAGSGSDVALMYAALGFAGEAGEIANKIKKYYRDGVLDANAVRKECGDALWYLARIIDELTGWLGAVAEQNLDKLEDRKDRGVLQGSGDDR